MRKYNFVISMEHEHREKKDTMTIKKSTYKYLVVGLVVVLMIGSFASGYIMGGSGASSFPTDAETLQQFLDALEQAQQPSQPSEQPETFSVSFDDDAVKGNPNAPVTIVEFSDFQCSFCARFFMQTLPQIRSEYIDTGKVKLIYRDFPLNSLHPQATPAALAAECAKEQDKFWEMHDLIFQNQGSLSDASYKQWASDLGLDTTQFNDCLDSGKYAEEVSKDLQDGVSAGVGGTPSFFVCRAEDDCEFIRGAQQFNVFKQVIDAALAA